jgi:hypothetical protein
LTLTINTDAEIGSLTPKTVQTSELSDPAGIIPTGMDTASALSLLLRRPFSTWRTINIQLANKLLAIPNEQ